MFALLPAGTALAGAREAGSSQGVARSRVAAPVLGVKHSFGPYSTGWGHARPKRLYNGGDPSGDIFSIHWSSWGGRVAHGKGKNAIFKPNGGYYPKPVHIELRARDLGRCVSGGPRTYRRLYAREPSRPGGPYGKWFVWTNYHPGLCTKLD